MEQLTRYQKQVLFSPIGEQGQQKIKESLVTIVGLGALGSVAASTLARAGVGQLRLVDRDFIELSNLQRQVLYDEKDVQRISPKAVAAAEKLHLVNSTINYEPLVQDVNFINVEETIAGSDVVLDATDNFEIRRLLNDACIKHNIPWIYGACLASYGLTLTINPGISSCLSCLYEQDFSTGTLMTCDTAGIISPISQIIASIQSSEALKILVGQNTLEENNLTFFDVWHKTFHSFRVDLKENCPTCRQGNFRYLSGDNALRTTSLCGRNSIQVTPPRDNHIDLQRMEKNLQQTGKVVNNNYLLKFSIDSYEMIIFRDGRAIIKGTEDERVARSLYARYIGS